jgi:hypothetical protein
MNWIDNQSKIQDSMVTNTKSSNLDGDKNPTESISTDNAGVSCKTEATTTALDKHMVGELARVTLAANSFRQHQPQWAVPFHLRNISPSPTPSNRSTSTQTTGAAARNRRNCSTTPENKRHRLPDDAPGSTISSRFPPARIPAIQAQKRCTLLNNALEHLPTSSVPGDLTRKRSRLPDDPLGLTISSSGPSARVLVPQDKKHRSLDWGPRSKYPRFHPN